MQVITLFHGQKALVDDDVFECLSQWRWHLTTDGYAARSFKVEKKVKVEKMHRIVSGARPGDIVDHINGNKLDNRRENLRFCTKSQNSMNAKRPITNTSGFKGVRWHKHTRRWYSTIGVNGITIHLGFFQSPEIAYKAYCEAADKYHGEFANHG